MTANEAQHPAEIAESQEAKELSPDKLIETEQTYAESVLGLVLDSLEEATKTSGANLNEEQSALTLLETMLRDSIKSETIEFKKLEKLELIEQITIGDNQVDIISNIELNPELMEAVASACVSVWMHESTDPEFKLHQIVLTDYMVNEDGSRSDNTAEFSGGRIKIAAARAAELFPSLSLKMNLEIVTAHETKHEAQIHNGEDVKPSAEYFEVDSYEGYVEDTHEIAAWQAAANYISAKYPGEIESFIFSGIKYDVPKTSKYSVLVPDNQL